MERLFEELGAEHRLIAAVLGSMERYLDAVERGEGHDRLDLFRFIVFLSDYADDIHHEKEERVLMKGMAKHGFSLLSGPLAHVKEQHERERGLFAALHRIAVDGGDLAEAVPAARELVAFERAHMAKENELLYPAARRELGQDDPAPLLAALDRFNAARDRDGHAAWLLRLAEDLTGRYPVVQT